MKNKVAIITGASRGIGAAIAHKLANQGLSILINDLKEEEINLNKVKNILAKDSHTVESFVADVRVEDDVKKMITFCIEKFGQIDFVINNAGIVYDKKWSTKTENEWLETYKTNVLGCFYMLKHAEKYLMQSDQPRVVNISSTNGTYATSSFSMDYDASKAALISLTKNISKILSPKGTANTILPGWVNTQMNDSLDFLFKEEEAKKIALERFAEPEEIANVVNFLCSKDASYINAAEIVVDGGRK